MSKLFEVQGITVMKAFTNSGTYSYHEQKNYFHATNNKKGDFEMAWGVSANGYQKRTFKIDYTIYDCVTVYNDCAEFYWQLIGNKLDIETHDIYGTVTLPSEIANKVLKQLKTIFPEVSSHEYINTYSWYYIANRNIINKAVRNLIYHTTIKKLALV